MSAFFVFIPAVNTSDSTPARRCSPWATGLLAGVLLQPTGAWAVTETYSGGGSTNGTGARTYDLIGAKSLISVGTQSSRNGEPVELHVAGGTYNATVGNSSLLPVYSNTYVGLADAWSTGILAASYGWNGFSTSTEPEPFPEAFYNGGNGGAVTLSVTDPASILLLDASSFPDALAASCPSGGCVVTVAGVMALSQGGRNSKWERTFDDYYSESGDGGAVSLTFQGQIEGRGSYATVSGTPIVGQEVGIMAISRGGVFDCTYHDCKENYDPGNVSQLPGRGGDVTVTLRAHPTSSEEINLSTGAAIGVLAVSANGAIVSDQDDAGFNVDASSVRAGKVNVTIGDAADSNAFDIRVGSDAKTTFGVGVLAVSAGSEATVPLHYQEGNVSQLRPSGGSGFGGDVTVNNAHGVIRAIGDSALGIVALSLGGEASIGLRGITQPGEYNLAKKEKNRPDVSTPLGTVTVINGEDSSIFTDGTGAHGIIAASLASGGITFLADVNPQLLSDHPEVQDPGGDIDGDDVSNIDDDDIDGDGIANAEDTDDDNDGLLDDPCVSGTPGEEPYCAGVRTSYVVGAASDGSPRKGGAVHVDNRGTIVSGNPQNIDGAYHAMGIFAQSVGGGGGSSSGSFWFWNGDKAGNGGDGGTVTVENSGAITTWGHFSTGILAQSIGGGGGSSGGNFAPFVAVGGKGGLGGDGASVSVTLDATGTIETHGAFAQGVIAQSIGGGGGKGGGSVTAGGWFALAVGGGGGSGGDGSRVTVSASRDPTDTAYPLYGTNPADAAPDANVFEIWTEGNHGVGILAQSIGGGGGAGGGSHTYSAGVFFDIALNVGGSGGSSGKGGEVQVDSASDVYTAGDDALGVVAQSIGGGGGYGGSSQANAKTVQLPDLPNGSYVLAVGGKGGAGGAAAPVALTSGGMVWTDGEQATGLLAQSIGGGGGAGGDAMAKNRSILVSASDEGLVVVAIDVTMSMGGDGGAGGNGSAVKVRNAYTDPADGAVTAGHVLTRSDNSIGILAQSIGGGGGSGGAGDLVSPAMGILKAITGGTNQTFGKMNFNARISVGVGGGGGTGGNGGYVEAYNGEQARESDGTWAITPGTIQTLGGNSPGMVLQSIGGGGGNGGSASVVGLGSLIDMNLAIGGKGGAAGNGSSVYALNPAGAIIRTGSVVQIASSPEDVADGASPFYRVTTGAGSVGILAQSVGGGGGRGGSADALSYFTDGFGEWFKDAGGAVKLVKLFKLMATGEWKQVLATLLSANINVTVGGRGGAGGDGGTVLVDNGGIIETRGDQGFGIHAQSVGGGGGTGAATEATQLDWYDFLQTFAGINVEFAIGGDGGAAGNGGTVTVNHYADGHISTSGHAAHGIFAQSIGGGGGSGGISANSLSSAIIALGFRWDGDSGISGKGGAVTVSSQGSIQTFGDDANGVLAQSIGDGGGSAAAPCTNTAGIAEQSPCWGNNEAATADPAEQDGFDWQFPLRFSVRLGGNRSPQPDIEEDGGNVLVTVSDDITTYGARSMGIVAQSIGGGGGYFSGSSAGFQVVDLAPSAGYSHSHGRDVRVDLKSSITTWGDGAWGVLAQSIGGGGGFAGDPSLDLGTLVSNTVPTQCCTAQGQKFTTGADGGNVNIHLFTGASITTYGKNAHGIFAQSIGGGGGIAAHWSVAPDWEGDENGDGILNLDDPLYWEAHRPDSLWAGNPTASNWDGHADPLWWTGQGNPITITVDSGATVAANGEGSIGIIAQGSGNTDFMRPITITVSGTVSGGSGFAANGLNQNVDDSPAAILVSGGESRRNKHDAVDTPNLITVSEGGRVYGYVDTNGSPDRNAVAIRSIYGYTDVIINAGGVVVGEVFLGTSSSDPDAGSLTNYGHWDPGPNNITANNSVDNHGLITISQPSVLEGSLKHYADGELQIALDPAVHFDKAALTVTGLARLEGKITPVIDNLLAGEFRLLKAGTLESSPSLDDPFLFDWAQRITADGELRLSALTDFRPAGLQLSGNQEETAQYLERAWEAADPHFASHFAYMLRMESGAEHGGMLDALGGAELLHQHAATLQAIPTLLGDAIDCPTMGGADVIVGEDSCAWMGVGQSWGRYTGKDTRDNDTDADLFSFGLQKEIRPGWFLSGVIGRVSSDADAGNVRSSERTTVGSLGVKHQRGNWILGASLAWGEGSYDSVRSFALPLAGGRASAPEAVLRSDSEMDIRALRTRVSYEFDRDGWYLRPTLDVDALQTETSGFDEEAGNHLFRLSGDGDSKRELVATPHVEIGALFDLGGENRLRAYVDAGVRLAPDADREMDVRISGANTSIGFMRNRMDVPLATGLLKVGAQIYRNDALDLRLEYGLEANDDFRNETATARVAWHF